MRLKYKIMWREKRELICIVIIALIYNFIIFDLIKRQILDFQPVIIEAKAEVKSVETIKQPEKDKSIEEQIKDQMYNAISGESFDIIWSLARCEGKNIKTGKVDNRYIININTGGTYDRGVLGWNNFYHPEVTDECAFDPACATKEALKLIKAGRGHEWVCWSKIWEKRF